MPTQLNRITLLGSSSGRNAGDAALIAAIMDGVDTACGRKLHYEIPTDRPSYINNEYPNQTKTVGMMPWQGAVRMLGIPTYRSLMKADAILVFDACLFDRSLYNPLFNFLSSFYLMLPRIKKKRGVPMVCFNVGLGPVFTPTGKKMLKTVLELMDFITVRDQDSFDLLREIGVVNPNVRLAADAALNAPASSREDLIPVFQKAGIDIDEPKLAINVNRYIDTWASADRESIGTVKFLEIYAKALELVAEKIDVPMVFVGTQHHDVEISEALMAKLPSSIRTAAIYNRDYNHAVIKGVLGQMDLLCGMRLHSLILASSELTPVVGIDYQPKVAYYFRELEQPERSMSFDDFTPENLATLILKGWENKQEMKAKLTARIPVLKAKAAWSADLMAAFEQGQDAFQKLWDKGPETL